jgi:hypothetical protein
MENQVEVQGRTFEKEQVKRILSSRMLITKPGKYQLKVTQTPYFYEEGKRYIINLGATTLYYVGVAKNALNEGNYQAALNAQLTGTVFVSDEGEVQGYLPQKGELVNVMITNHINKNNETILVVDSIAEVPVAEAKKAEGLFDDFFNEDTNDMSEAAKQAEKELQNS